MKSEVLLRIIVVFPLTILAADDASEVGKGMPFFHVVRFPNIDCSTSSGENGTCYTSQECSTRNGTSDGNCANGFGVCCRFRKSCDDISYENITYFVSNENEGREGLCSLKICKMNPSICQLRIDFETFIINGPSKESKVIGKSTGVSLATQCLTDTFFVTGPQGGTPPIICGTNSGQHIYVEASSQCNSLVFHLSKNGKLVNREWNLKIVQLSCSDSALAPPGCTQYFRQTVGTIQSFNWRGGAQLANQRQNICFRREVGFCKICFYANDPNDFAVSGKNGTQMKEKSKCCGNGKEEGFDCVMIPGAEANGPLPSPSFCGNGAGLFAKNEKSSATICTSLTPFQFNFVSDQFTLDGSKFMGFKLNFFQSSCVKS